MIKHARKGTKLLVKLKGQWENLRVIRAKDGWLELIDPNHCDHIEGNEFKIHQSYKGLRRPEKI